MSTTIETKYDVGDIVTLTNVGSAPVRSYRILGFQIYYDMGEPYGVIEESRLEGKVTKQCPHRDWQGMLYSQYPIYDPRVIYKFCPKCGNEL